jgi:hypothetical protein
MRSKLIGLGVVYLVGGLIVMLVSARVFSDAYLWCGPVLWLLVFGVLQWRMLRCPTCGQYVLTYPDGSYHGFPETECLKCGEPLNR